MKWAFTNQHEYTQNTCFAPVPVTSAGGSGAVDDAEANVDLRLPI